MENKRGEMDSMSCNLWSKEDIDYLEKKWGVLSIPALAKDLNRSVHSVRLKACRLRLGGFIDSSGYITVHELFSVLGIKGYSFYLGKYSNLGLPYKDKKVKNNCFRVINIDDFWKWAESNKDNLDFKRFKEHSLGKEPSWVKEKRKEDIEKARGRSKKAWTKEEESLLMTLFKSGFSYKDISIKLSRSDSAIRKRIYIIQLKRLEQLRMNKALEHAKSIEKSYIKAGGNIDIDSLIEQEKKKLEV